MNATITEAVISVVIAMVAPFIFERSLRHARFLNFPEFF